MHRRLLLAADTQVAGASGCSGIECNPNPSTVLEGDGGALSGASQIAVGYDFTCALVGTAVECFGANMSGTLGQGTTDSNAHAVPTAVAELSGTPMQIVAGGEFACALIQGTGAVQCWGDNQTNELGPNAVDAGTQSASPVTVLTGATRIAATTHGACAVMSDTSMQCWGGDLHGELGRGSASSSDFPTPAPVSAQY